MNKLSDARTFFIFIFILFLYSTALGQFRISGLVLDAQNRPIPGVTVRVQRGDSLVASRESNSNGIYEVPFSGGTSINVTYQNGEVISLIPTLSGRKNHLVNKILGGSRIAQLNAEDKADVDFAYAYIKKYPVLYADQIAKLEPIMDAPKTDRTAIQYFGNIDTKLNKILEQAIKKTSAYDPLSNLNDITATSKDYSAKSINGWLRSDQLSIMGSSYREETYNFAPKQSFTGNTDLRLSLGARYLFNTRNSFGGTDSLNSIQIPDFNSIIKSPMITSCGKSSSGKFLICELEDTPWSIKTSPRVLSFGASFRF